MKDSVSIAPTAATGVAAAAARAGGGLSMRGAAAATFVGLMARSAGDLGCGRGPPPTLQVTIRGVMSSHVQRAQQLQQESGVSIAVRLRYSLPSPATLPLTFPLALTQTALADGGGDKDALQSFQRQDEDLGGVSSRLDSAVVTQCCQRTVAFFGWSALAISKGECPLCHKRGVHIDSVIDLPVWQRQEREREREREREEREREREEREREREEREREREERERECERREQADAAAAAPSLVSPSAPQLVAPLASQAQETPRPERLQSERNVPLLHLQLHEQMLLQYEQHWQQLLQRQTHLMLTSGVPPTMAAQRALLQPPLSLMIHPRTLQQYPPQMIVQFVQQHMAAVNQAVDATATGHRNRNRNRNRSRSRSRSRSRR